MLALSYCFVMAPFESWAIPPRIILKLLVLIVFFVVYAGAVNRIARRIGLHAIFIAVLWLPLEYGLNRLGGINQILTLPENDSGLLIRIGTLFGMLMVSFVIVLANILILILLKEVIEALVMGAKLDIERLGRHRSWIIEAPYCASRCTSVSTRAPPFSSVSSI